MKTRQKSIRVFEIITENYDKFIRFASTREATLRKYLLIIKTNNSQIKEFLKSTPFEYKVVSPSFEASNEEIEIEVQNEVDNKINEEKKECKTEIYDRIIRSGEEINSNNKLVFLKRINAGAKIISSEAIELFDEVEGVVICNGDYMIVKKNSKGTIIFNNEDIKIEKLSFISKDGIKEL